MFDGCSQVHIPFGLSRLDIQKSPHVKRASGSIWTSEACLRALIKEAAKQSPKPKGSKWEHGA